MNKIAVTCVACGASFERWPSDARAPSLFCSNLCRAKHQASERMIQTAEQFWSKVAVGEPGECWPWTAYRTPAGYGQTAWKGKPRLSHRIALALTDGDWESRLHVCHSCDRPSCCNPAHLWRGTHRDNMHDMIRKGRDRKASLKGERHPAAILTAEQVADIRASKEAPAVLAERHGIRPNYVSALRSRGAMTWSDIPIVPKTLRTHCHKGHEYAGHRNPDGYRICPTCHSERNLAYRLRRKENRAP